MCAWIFFFFFTNVLPFSKYSLASLLSHCRAVSCENDLLILVNSLSATHGHSLASWTSWEELGGWRDQGDPLAVVWEEV